MSREQKRERDGRFAEEQRRAALPANPEDLRLIASAIPLNTGGTREEFDESVEKAREAFELVLRGKVRKYHHEHPEPYPEQERYVQPVPVEMTYEEAQVFLRTPNIRWTPENAGMFLGANQAVNRHRNAFKQEVETHSTLIGKRHECEIGDECGGATDPESPTCEDATNTTFYDHLITGELADRIRERMGVGPEVEVHTVESFTEVHYSEVTIEGYGDFYVELSNGMQKKFVGETLHEWLHGHR